jgi:hypothetical protein
MLIPNRTFGDVLANLGALALGLTPYGIPLLLIVLVVLV